MVVVGMDCWLENSRQGGTVRAMTYRDAIKALEATPDLDAPMVVDFLRYDGEGEPCVVEGWATDKDDNKVVLVVVPFEALASSDMPEEWGSPLVSIKLQTDGDMWRGAVEWQDRDAPVAQVYCARPEQLMRWLTQVPLAQYLTAFHTEQVRRMKEEQ